MSMRKTRSVLMVWILALGATPALADMTLFYAGDPNGSTATYNMDLQSPYPPPYSYEITDRVYDNFVVPTGQTWSVNDIFAVISDPGGGFASASYQIRTGMDGGQNGTLVASGTLPALITPLSGVPTINGLPSERLDVDLATPLVLQGGTTYWVSLVPVAFDSFNRFIGSGTANAVNAPTTSQDFLYTYRTGYGGFNDPGTYYPYLASSLGVAGTETTAAPEPASIAHIGIAAMIGLRYAYRRRKRRPAHPVT